MTMMKRRWSALPALALAVLAAFPASAEISDGRIKIGVLTDMAGVYSDLAGRGSIVAAKMALEDFGPTVAGVPIEIVSSDHQNKPDIAATRARAWYDAEGVDVIVDITGSASALAVHEVARQMNRISIVSGAGVSRVTNEDCSPVGLHWVFDTYALAVGTAKAVLEEGGDSWFLLTVDYAYGHVLEKDVRRVLDENGGTVLGSVRTPFPTTDFSSFLLQAQASGAKIIGLANAGQDTVTSIKQAHEFGITEMGQQLAGLTVFITDAHALGPEIAQGLLLTTGFYWDLDDETRAWSDLFFERTGQMPSMAHAGVYSSTLHYLRAVEAAGTDDAATVIAKMKEMPIDDFFARNGYLRDDGRMVHDMYLARIKTPEESESPWDLYNILRVMPGEEAFRPLSESECPLVQ
ncbi:MAG: ABC transporter substrate-binding protein [Alphaproteobacteria bacterium]